MTLIRNREENLQPIKLKASKSTIKYPLEYQSIVLTNQIKRETLNSDLIARFLIWSLSSELLFDVVDVVVDVDVGEVGDVGDEGIPTKVKTGSSM